MLVLGCTQFYLKGIVMNKLVLATLLSTVIATVAYAYTITHPNLKSAYDSAGQAIQHIKEAQQYSGNKATEFGGHAEKAESLLTQAQQELVEGDKYNDAHQKKPK